MFLTRAHLRRDRGIAAIAPLLIPFDQDALAMAAHRLVWALFGDTPERQRDFLWRQQEPGVFLTLSARPPTDAGGLFSLEQPRPFKPHFSSGDQLEFMLRANPVVSVPAFEGRGKRQDVITQAMARMPPKERSSRRQNVLDTVGAGWLDAQGKTAGFRLKGAPTVDGNQWHRIPRTGRHHAIQIVMLDFAGALEVTDPERFVVALARGFGRAKAFGCGLMLVRRA